MLKKSGLMNQKVTLTHFGCVFVAVTLDVAGMMMGSTQFFITGQKGTHLLYIFIKSCAKGLTRNNRASATLLLVCTAEVVVVKQL